MAEKQHMLVFVGSYAEASDSGVYVYAFDEEKEELTLLDSVAGLKNPTFLNLDAAKRRLYSIAEGVSEDGGKVGEAVSFDIDASTGRLAELSRGIGVDAPACHIQRDAAGRYLILTSYHGGRIALSALGEDGRIGALLDTQQYEGHGPDPERQDRPHPHSVNLSRDKRFLFVPDLGMDRIRVYRVDPQENRLAYHGETTTHPGAGPRHMAFHPNGKLAFSINEVDSTVTSFRYDSEAGTLQEIEHVPTLPAGFTEENTCAEIAVSEDGRFLYGSNRGHDSIVVFRVDEETGRLALVEHVPTRGGHPRHFALLPGGRHLLAANRDSENNLVLFRVDKQTGRLDFTGHAVTVSKPVCVQAAYFPR
ncbi:MULTISPECIES: lactonase family protein [Paenibacillus]|uniref:lactonase family protein n=1 Tax=Paenibacillus TaxID=44249 RepID=UPI0022B8D22F|nr:lactonase family protein [Paenibacillus caseinilyticus]MCZ8519808.1 lactonase family protein [Paenibacillus caseinilyticus]